METFAVKDLTFAYPESERKALSHFSLTIKEGAFTTICGRSGCGKSTLLRQLKPCLAPHGEKSGQIFFQGKLLEAVSYTHLKYL